MKKKRSSKKISKKKGKPNAHLTEFLDLLQPNADQWLQSLRYVPRPRNKPSGFSTTHYTKLKHELGNYWLEGGIRSKQRRFDMAVIHDFIKSRLSQDLMELFDGRCAFTGLPASGIGWFRPPSDAQDNMRNVSPEHYWWLTLEWHNLYPVTKMLEHRKSSVFPVFGKRSRIPKSINGKPQLDVPVLIDPCRDHHAWYFKINKDFELTPADRISRDLTPAGAAYIKERMRQSLDIYNLNMFSTREYRGWTVNRCESILAALKNLPNSYIERLSEYPIIESEVQRSYVSRLDSGEAPPFDLPESWLRVDSDFILYIAAIQFSLKGFSKHAPDLAPRLFRLARRAYRDFLLSLPEGVVNPNVLKEIHTRSSASLKTSPSVSSELISISQISPVHLIITDRDENDGPLIGAESIIERVSVKNFRSIRDAVLEFGGSDLGQDEAEASERLASSRSDEDQDFGSSWTMLLGENGTGKSSWLQTIAIALLGEKLGTLSPTDEPGFWDKVLHKPRDPNTPRPKQGRVKIEFRDGAVIDLRFNANKAWYHGLDPRINIPIRAYGATRLLPAPDQDKEKLAREVNESVRVINLFNPRAAIIDAETWLLSLNEGDFNAAAVVLTDILGRGKSAEDLNDSDEGSMFVTRGPKRNPKWVRIDGDDLSEASDGYRSSICLACDIMANLGKGFSDIRHATGMVLIDEIGSHLHPRWKMRFTKALRSNFSRVQFVATTHEPLCLRGLHAREVTRVTKDPVRGVVLERIDRSPSDLRPDQLLTSEFFGLHSVIDPDLDNQFQEYYTLLSMDKDNLNSEQTDRLHELRSALANRRVLGHTRRDQLVYEAIDTFLANQKGQGKQSKPLDEKTKRTVLEIWGVSAAASDLNAHGRGSI